MPQALKTHCLIPFWSWMNSLFSLLALWGNKNWTPRIKVEKIENLRNKTGLGGCNWSSLNAPGTSTPLPHPFLVILICPKTISYRTGLCAGSTVSELAAASLSAAAASSRQWPPRRPPQRQRASILRRLRLQPSTGGRKRVGRSWRTDDGREPRLRTGCVTREDGRKMELAFERGGSLIVQRTSHPRKCPNELMRKREIFTNEVSQLPFALNLDLKHLWIWSQLIRKTTFLLTLLPSSRGENMD